MITTSAFTASTALTSAIPLREALQSRLGVRELSFDLLRLMFVEHDEAMIRSDHLREAITGVGFRRVLPRLEILKGFFCGRLAN